LYFFMIKLRTVRWSGNVACMRVRRNSYKILVGERQIRKSRLISRWNLERGWFSMGWIVLAQDREHWKAAVNTVMNLQVP
jgi:hypothetical protein